MKDKKKAPSTAPRTKVEELKATLRKLRFDNALGQLDDTSKIRKTRKSIAGLLTLEKKGKDGS